jgi:hypothetical protein
MEFLNNINETDPDYKELMLLHCPDSVLLLKALSACYIQNSAFFKILSAILLRHGDLGIKYNKILSTCWVGKAFIFSQQAHMVGSLIL